MTKQLYSYADGLATFTAEEIPGARWNGFHGVRIDEDEYQNLLKQVQDQLDVTGDSDLKDDLSDLHWCWMIRDGSGWVELSGGYNIVPVCAS